MKVTLTISSFVATTAVLGAWFASATHPHAQFALTALSNAQENVPASAHPHAQPASTALPNAPKFASAAVHPHGQTASTATSGVSTATAEDYTRHAYCGFDHEIPSIDIEGLELKQVTILARHGDRTRNSNKSCWENDENVEFSCSISSSIWNPIIEKSARLPGGCDFGVLTDKGYDQEVQVGTALRSSYEKFLPATYEEDPSSFFFRSTDKQRVILSGHAITQGLFPAKIGLSHIPWTLNKYADDDMKPDNTVTCPGLTSVLEGIQDSDEFRKLVNDATNWFRVLSDWADMGKDYYTMNGGFGRATDCYHTHKCHGHPIPEPLVEPLEKIVEQMDLRYGYRWNADNGIVGNKGIWGAMQIGTVLNEIFENMKNTVSEKEAYKFSLYAGHDIGPIMPLMAAFKSYFGWPPYSSVISIELYEQTATAEFFVRVVYNNNVVGLPDCDGKLLCPFGEFESIVTNIINLCEQYCFPMTEEPTSLRS